ncbi:MAG: hypothetical protein KGL35_19310 [Bradyrhizobium sp.]|nr:hypothetical protein [Bradyrhizobium sp.]
MTKREHYLRTLETAARLLREKETLMAANEALRAELAEYKRRCDVYSSYIKSVAGA